jgi:hypothetical protein
MSPLFYVGIILILIVIGVLVYYFMNQGDDSSSDDSSPKKGELVITEEGTETGKSKKENYIQVPDLNGCQGDKQPEYCKGYDSSPEKGFAYVYDLSIDGKTGPNYTECPGGGHECWYVEQYDEEGALVGIVDRDGKSMLDKIVEDVWNDKWSSDHPMVKTFTKAAEYKDEKLIAKEKFSSEQGKKIEVGEVIKVGDMPTAFLYFIVLFAAMKAAGAEKPSKITLKIKGSKEKFDDMMSRRKGGKGEAKPPPSSD